jgi:hypothetical protein
MSNGNDAREPMMQFFVYDNTHPVNREIGHSFAELAKLITELLPRNPERTVAMRKLLEARDCCLRAKSFRAEG